MNTAKIYSDITGKTERAEARAIRDNEGNKVLSQSPAEDAARFQARISWLQSTVTQEMFGQIRDTIKSLQEKARQYSRSLQPCDYYKIANIMIEAQTLQNIIDVYGRTDNN